MDTDLRRQPVHGGEGVELTADALDKADVVQRWWAEIVDETTDLEDAALQLLLQPAEHLGDRHRRRRADGHGSLDLHGHARQHRPEAVVEVSDEAGVAPPPAIAPGGVAGPLEVLGQAHGMGGEAGLAGEIFEELALGVRERPS